MATNHDLHEATTPARSPRHAENDRENDNAATEPGKDRNDKERLRKEWQRLKDRQRTWTPWLLMQYALYDLGFRPMPDGVPHWISPRIFVESSDALGRAVAGEENYVHAKVFNLGMATSAPTRVDFYWADPSLGLGASNMNLIGTEWVEIDNGSAKDVRCNTPWVPVFLNDGHECLMVNCNNAMRDPIQHPFQPRLDRHVGQRNIQVIEATPGSMFTLALTINNLFGIATRAVLTAKIQHLEVAPAALEQLAFPEIVNRLASFGPAMNTPRELLALYKTGTREYRQAAQMAKWAEQHDMPRETLVRSLNGSLQFSRASGCINAEWDEHSCFIKQSGAEAMLTDSLAANRKLSHLATVDDLVFAESKLLPHEQRKLKIGLGVPTGAKEGEFIVFHLAQRAEGVIVGGYTVVVKVVAA